MIDGFIYVTFWFDPLRTRVTIELVFMRSLKQSSLGANKFALLLNLVASNALIFPVRRETVGAERIPIDSLNLKDLLWTERHL